MAEASPLSAPFAPDAPPPLVELAARREPVPIESLPIALRGGVEAIAAHAQVDTALAANSVLAAAGFIAQAHVNVMLLQGQVAPVSQFFLSVASSGDRKTTTDKFATGAIRNYQTELMRAFRIECDAKLNEVAVWDMQRKLIMDGAKPQRGRNAPRPRAPEDIQADLDQLGPKPELPPLPMFLSSEPNFEGIIRLFRDGPGTLALIASEGGQFLHGYAMNPDNRMKTASAFNNIWDGGEVDRVRGGDDLLLMTGKRLSCHLMVQPLIAQSFVGDEALRDQGLLSRFCMAAPVSLMGARMYREPSAADRQALAQYERHLDRLVRLPLPYVPDTRNELAPRTLELCADARDMLIAHANEVEAQIGPEGALRPISGVAAKSAEIAARFAAVFTFVDMPHADAIRAGAMADAICIARWYLNEALRIRDECAVPPDLADAEAIWSWLTNGSWAAESHFGIPDLQRFGPSALRRDRKTFRPRADSAIKRLTENGNLVAAGGTVEVQGQSRRSAWRVVRRPS